MPHSAASTPLTAGTPGRTWDGDWFCITESVHRPRQVVKTHAHNHPDITLVFQGGYETGRVNRRHECTPGTALFLPGGYEHDDRFAEDFTRSAIVELRAPEWERLGRRTQIPRVSALLAGAGMGRAARDIKAALSAGGEIIAIEELIIELLGRLVRFDDGLCRESRPAWLRSACEEIRAGFRTGVRLHHLALRVERHPVHFARAFRDHMGCSVGQFIEQLRIDAACTALASTAQPICEIAISLGFYDQPHFARVFRRRVGIAPLQFRLDARSGRN